MYIEINYWLFFG